MPNALEAAVLRTLAWFMALGYPPLEEELIADVDLRNVEVEPSRKELEATIETLMAGGIIKKNGGRFVVSSYESLFAERAQRERVFPRKWKRAQRLAWWVRRLPSVRFLAICNTTALGAARDEADIDIFVVTRRGSLWLTRGVLALLAMLIGQRPGQRFGERDAWCFSFLIDDADLSLQTLALQPTDPYFRFWFRHLVPLLDDGVGQALWTAQAWTHQHEPFARSWISWQDLPNRSALLPRWFQKIDEWAMTVQRRFGSRALWRAADRPDTAVVLHKHVCKTHMDDRRQLFRERYEAICGSLGITA